jgi:hypothetical protein
MNEFYAKKLNSDFPKIFKGDFHFSVSDGWYKLLHDLCTNIENECKRLGVEDKDWPVASQVKQKYGGLRFYMYSAPSTVWDMISTAESESEGICEVCGKPGETNDKGGWINTSCKACL